MFEKSIAALKMAEEAIAAELEALWVPWDGQSGAVYWHDAAAGALKDAAQAAAAIRSALEVKEPPVAAPVAEVEAPTEAPVTEPAQEADTTTQEVVTVNA